MSRIVVVTGDSLGERMAGPAIRAWEISRLLSPKHEVVLATLGMCDLTHADFKTVVASLQTLHDLERWCDLLIFQGYLLASYPWLANTDKVLVADIYDPFHLESLEWDRFSPEPARWANLKGAVDALNQQLDRADFMLCASERQRGFWLGQLAGRGRLNPATYDADHTVRGLIDVAPFGIREEPPVQSRNAIRNSIPGISLNDEVVVWGGGVYNWLDPQTLVRAIAKLASSRPTLRLVFLGMKHPTEGIPEMQAALETRQLSDDLELTNIHVFFNEGWVPYADRHNYLMDADIGVSCHLDHIETAFSFRTRVLDYLWTGLPIVCTSGDSFADLVETNKLGLTVEPQDPDALAGALSRLFTSKHFALECRSNVALVASQFHWRTAMAPLVEFCDSPRPAPDRTVGSTFVDEGPEMSDGTSADPGHESSRRGRASRAVMVWKEEGVRGVIGRVRDRRT